MANSKQVTFYSDIAFSETTTDLITANTNTRLNFGYSFNSGTGNTDTDVSNFFDTFAKFTGLIASGAEDVLNFSGLTHQLSNGTTETKSFLHVNGIVISNNDTADSGNVLLVRATGTDAFTNVFNGESGNLKLNPYGTWQYLDYYGTTKVTGSNRLLTIANTGSTTGIEYTYMVVGYTGTS